MGPPRCLRLCGRCVRSRYCFAKHHFWAIRNWVYRLWHKCELGRHLSQEWHNIGVSLTGGYLLARVRYISLNTANPRGSLYLLYLGIGRFVLAYIYNTLLTYNAYRIVRNVRHDYLRSALRQETAYFDMGTGGSIATQAYSSGRLVQNGIAEKLGLTLQGASAFISSFIIAFVTNWKLTLIICVIAPLTVSVMTIISFIEAGYETKILDYYALANSFAENVFASIRTVHAFEMRPKLVKTFDDHLESAHRVGSKISLLLGILFSAEYTIIYLGMALAFWQGIRMISSNEVRDTGDVFT